MFYKYCGLLFSFVVIAMFFKLGMTAVGMTGVVGAVVIYKLCHR